MQFILLPLSLLRLLRCSSFRNAPDRINLHIHICNSVTRPVLKVSVTSIYIAEMKFIWFNQCDGFYKIDLKNKICFVLVDCQISIFFCYYSDCSQPFCAYSPMFIFSWKTIAYRKSVNVQPFSVSIFSNADSYFSITYRKSPYRNVSVEKFSTVHTYASVSAKYKLFCISDTAKLHSHGFLMALLLISRRKWAKLQKQIKLFSSLTTLIQTVYKFSLQRISKSNFICFIFREFTTVQTFHARSNVNTMQWEMLLHFFEFKFNFS